MNYYTLEAAHCRHCEPRNTSRQSHGCPVCGSELLAVVDISTESVDLFPACTCDLTQQAYALEREAVKRAHERGPQEYVRWEK